MRSTSAIQEDLAAAYAMRRKVMEVGQSMASDGANLSLPSLAELNKQISLLEREASYSRGGGGLKSRTHGGTR